MVPPLVAPRTPDMDGESASTRLAPLDALRGFAAIFVAVFSHYQHFGGDKKTYPFMEYTATAWLYEYSWLFVDLFFLLSGFVFTYRYLESVSSQRLNGREFFLLRFSRLYPLHFFTLLACAAVQWSLLARHKPLVIYETADLYHFFLQLFYLHTWFEFGWSYNEPSWSVCSEVFVYALFFYFASRYAKTYTVACVIAAFIGIAVQKSWSLPLPPSNIARAMVGFFGGSLLFQAVRACDRAGYGRVLGFASLAVFVTVAVLAWFIGYKAWIGGSPLPHCFVVFPLVILMALRVPFLSKVLSARPFTFLGDISYAVYLVHVPSQMLAIATLRGLGVTIPTATRGFFLGYAVVLIGIATLAHYAIERPTRKWFRRGLRTSPSESVVALRAAS